MDEQVKTITIDNKTYDAETLPDRVKSLLSVHQEWTNELRVQRLTYAKTEAALRDLVREIIAVVADEKVEPIVVDTVEETLAE